MADARKALELALEEADLLPYSGATIEQVRPIIRLAHNALHAGDGEIADEEVRKSGLHPSKLARLGL